jgi:hypothetical protein
MFPFCGLVPTAPICCDEIYSWLQSGPLKTTVTGVEMFKKILDHGEVKILKAFCAWFCIDPNYLTCKLCAGW